MVLDKYKQPLFILGNPRSGTSLLRLMLSCHPHIVIPPESHFFLWLESKYGQINPMEDPLDEFMSDLENSRKFETWNINNSTIIQNVKENRPCNYSELITCVYLVYADRVGKSGVKFWGDKNKLWKDKLPKIIKYYPQAYFIHLVRDGRDVACSFKDLAKNKNESDYAPKLPDNIHEIAERWKANVNFIESFSSNLQETNRITILYEDLVLDSHTVLHKITDMLGLTYTQGMLDYQNPEYDQLMEPREFLGWKEKLKSAPDKNNIGKYNNELASEEIQIFNQLAGAELNRFGYLI